MINKDAVHSIINFFKSHNFIVHQQTDNDIYFSTKGIPGYTDYKTNKLYNSYFRDGTLTVAGNNESIDLKWRITISYTLMYCVGVLLAAFLFISIYFTVRKAMLYAPALSGLMFIYIYINIKLWTKKITQMMFRK